MVALGSGGCGAAEMLCGTLQPLPLERQKPVNAVLTVRLQVTKPPYAEIELAKQRGVFSLGY